MEVLGKLFKIHSRIGRTRAHINFVTKCIKFNFLPKGFLSRFRSQAKKAAPMELRFCKIQMREQRAFLYGKLHNLTKEASSRLNSYYAKWFLNQIQLRISQRSIPISQS